MEIARDRNTDFIPTGRAGDIVKKLHDRKRIAVGHSAQVRTLLKEQGVWVFRAGVPLPASSTDGVKRRLRLERDRINLGKFK